MVNGSTRDSRKQFVFFLARMSLSRLRFFVLIQLDVGFAVAIQKLQVSYHSYAHTQAQESQRLRRYAAIAVVTDCRRC